MKLTVYDLNDHRYRRYNDGGGDIRNADGVVGARFVLFQGPPGQTDFHKLTRQRWQMLEFLNYVSWVIYFQLVHPLFDFHNIFPSTWI